MTSFTCSVHLRSSLSRVPNNLNFLTLHGGNNHLLGLASFSISVLINYAQILVWVFERRVRVFTGEPSEYHSLVQCSENTSQHCLTIFPEYFPNTFSSLIGHFLLLHTWPLSLKLMACQCVSYVRAMYVCQRTLARVVTPRIVWDKHPLALNFSSCHLLPCYR